MHASEDPNAMALQRSRFRTYAAADPLGWFERLYAEAEAGRARIPWDLGAPDVLLRDWLRGWLPGWLRERTRQPPRGAPVGSAIVVGCGLGRDAELVADAGFDTTAFDISETAIRLARQRSGDTPVSYVVADLLDPPPDWEGAFDLVVECITVQALPESLRAQAIQNVAGLVGSGGTLIVVALRQPDGEQIPPGPPWPLSRSEIEAFATSDLRPIRVEEVTDPTYAGRQGRWRAEFHRP